jgi:hypothetical protein
VAFSSSFWFLYHTIILSPTVNHLASRFYQSHPLYPPLLGKERGRNKKEGGKAPLFKLLSLPPVKGKGTPDTQILPRKLLPLSGKVIFPQYMSAAEEE